MKQKTTALLISAAAGLGTLAFAVAPGRATPGQKAPFYGRYFAHRGLHTGNSAAPENSITAFRMAANVGYGVELEVHLTADNQEVVFHDSDLSRMTGAEGKIEEFTYDQLQQLRLDHSAETIPLLKDVLQVIAGSGPIILELKPAGKQRSTLCRLVCDLLEDYPGDVCVESFDPLALKWFRRHAPEYLRGQLAAPPWEYDRTVSPPLAFLLGNCLCNFLSRPQFIAYKLGHKPAAVHLAEAMGAMTVSWTSTSLKDKKHQDAIIFEHYRPDLFL